MRVTPEEAKTKWCPFARQLDWVPTSEESLPVNGGTANRDYKGLPLETTLCIADQCMAWKLYRYNQEDPEASKGYCGAFGIG